MKQLYIIIDNLQGIHNINHFVYWERHSVLFGFPPSITALMRASPKFSIGLIGFFAYSGWNIFYIASTLRTLNWDIFHIIHLILKLFVIRHSLHRFLIIHHIFFATFGPPIASQFVLELICWQGRHLVLWAYSQA